MANEITVGSKKTFKTNDTELKHLDGTEVTIVSVITKADKTHDQEVLPMYVLDIKHKDKAIEAWSDELLDIAS